MQNELILSIDYGTQSVRAMIFDPTGNMIAKSQIHVEPYFSISPGLAEQYPEVFWGNFCQACQGVWKNHNNLKNRIAGVVLTTQRSTVINLDKNGDPLRPAIVWLDQRRTHNLPTLGGIWGFIFKISGMTKTVAYLQAEAEANWIFKHQPDIWKKTHKYIFLSGYLTYKLTSNFADSIGCQVGYVPFDYKHMQWSGKYDWKWKVLPIEEDQLVTLVKPSQTLGEITAKAEQETGIPKGLPLIASAADKACEVLGSGCIDPSIACLSYGTTATINTTHKKYIEIIPLIPPYPAAVPDSYSLEYQIYRGFWMVSWFKKEFAHQEIENAKILGIEPEILFDEMVNQVPPGSQGLILQPFWSPGLKYPGPEARGTVIGFNDIHTRAHFYRAILEGLAFALLDGAKRTSSRSGIPIKEVRVAGGGSQSDAALQLTADIFGLKTSRPRLYEASGLGAAINAAVGLGFYPNFDQAVHSMTQNAESFEPNINNHELYSQLFTEIYQPLYNHVRPLYEKLQSIQNFAR